MTDQKPNENDRGSWAGSSKSVSELTRLQASNIVFQTAMTGRDMIMTARVLLEQLCTHWRVDAAAFWRFDQALNSLELFAWHGEEPRPNPEPIYDVASGFPGQILNSSDSFYFSSALEKIPFSRYDMVAGRNFHAYGAIKVTYAGQITGIVEVYAHTQDIQDPAWCESVYDICRQSALAFDMAKAYGDVNQTNQFLLAALRKTIASYANALDMHEYKAAGHSSRLAKMAVCLGRHLELKDTDLVQIEYGALLHDLGKVVISDSILLKPGSLTEKEWAIMRQHTQTGYELLQENEYLSSALDILHFHHERWDGNGYPEGLKGDQIPFITRIFSVADVWECLLSERPFRHAFSEKEAIAYLEQQSGGAFDPQIIEAFLKYRIYDMDRKPKPKPLLLIVDDEPNITNALSRSLRSDFEVYTANSAETALQLLNQKKFDIILTDQRMPDITGVQLLRMARSMQPLSAGFLISAYLDSNVLAEAINLGNVFGFVAKPWDLTDLHRKLLAVSAIADGPC